MAEATNAGHRLWNVQKSQGTGLCVGLDPHAYPVEQGRDFYTQFKNWPGGREAFVLFYDLLRIMNGSPLTRQSIIVLPAEFLAGLVAYYLAVIEAAWSAGIRLFKPQAAFYELFEPFGDLIVEILLKRLEDLAHADPTITLVIFRVKDAKRGDIDSTQRPYYLAILSDVNSEIYPGMNGRQGFDTMTVSTWMGLDVLTPGLELFRQGHGAIVVTRTSNPSGTTLQDAFVRPNMLVELTAKQEPFRYTNQNEREIMDILDDRQPMAHELMLWQTEKFSRDNGLNQDGISPLFSVMGSTVKMLGSFRQLRPGGIALVPGFGEQGGAFANVMPLHIAEGPLAGHLGILSSSRAHNFPWMTKYGGSGDPNQLAGEMRRMIDKFRAEEKEAYDAAGYSYPF